MSRRKSHHTGSGATIALATKSCEFAVWGREHLDAATLDQMRTACRLPISVAGAQMPDGHVGYGLPIGGVLATRGAVIPYAVGVDIACRVKLTVTPEPFDRFEGWRDRLRKALLSETVFGAGGSFDARNRRDHHVMEDDAWADLPGQLRALRDGKAHAQLGTSGGGNHFVEWGEFVLEQAALGLEPGRYLALLSHSGSRGFGFAVCEYYKTIAMEKCPLPPEAKFLAWLDLATDAGLGYWQAMELAGRYASANHHLIHRHVLRAAGLDTALSVENHHNFAWKEVHFGEELIVHRKGATPAGPDDIGFIPGTMADPGYLIRGRGNPESLNSSAHGAGRRMSRKAAEREIDRRDWRNTLSHRRVELISAGADEAPAAYKSIADVMAAQSDLVEVLGAFQPRLVRMADDGSSED